MEIVAVLCSSWTRHYDKDENTAALLLPRQRNQPRHNAFRTSRLFCIYFQTKLLRFRDSSPCVVLFYLRHWISSIVVGMLRYMQGCTREGNTTDGRSINPYICTILYQINKRYIKILTWRKYFLTARWFYPWFCYIILNGLLHNFSGSTF